MYLITKDFKSNNLKLAVKFHQLGFYVYKNSGSLNLRRTTGGYVWI